jgi:hypothetical protein
MVVNLNIRGLPDDVHETLVRRARSAGMSLRRYSVLVLSEHCALPTVNEWLDGLSDLPATSGSISGAEAVSSAREADDETVTGAGADRG